MEDSDDRRCLPRPVGPRQSVTERVKTSRAVVRRTDPLSLSARRSAAAPGGGRPEAQSAPHRVERVGDLAHGRRSERVAQALPGRRHVDRALGGNGPESGSHYARGHDAGRRALVVARAGQGDRPGHRLVSPGSAHGETHPRTIHMLLAIACGTPSHWTTGTPSNITPRRRSRNGTSRACASIPRKTPF